MTQTEQEFYNKGVKDASNAIYKQVLPLVFKLIEKYNIPTEYWTWGSSILESTLKYFLTEEFEGDSVNVVDVASINFAHRQTTFEQFVKKNIDDAAKLMGCNPSELIVGSEGNIHMKFTKTTNSDNAGNSEIPPKNSDAFTDFAKRYKDKTGKEAYFVGKGSNMNDKTLPFEDIKEDKNNCCVLFVPLTEGEKYNMSFARKENGIKVYISGRNIANLFKHGHCFAKE